VGLTSRISKAYQQLEQEFEREPTSQELADLLHLPVEEVSYTMNAGFRHVSMDAPLMDGEGGAIIDLMENTNASPADEKVAHYESLHQEIERSLQILTDRQKTVLCYFFGIGIDHALSLEDIGRRFNLTRERVRQIKDKAITKLRTTKRSKYLKVYLG
jgi:RNA polymerase primary sigma factor